MSKATILSGPESRLIQVSLCIHRAIYTYTYMHIFMIHRNVLKKCFLFFWISYILYMKSFSNETLIFFLQKVLFSSTFWILPKLNEFCEPRRKNPLEILEWKSFLWAQENQVLVWICYFAPVISQRYIKYTLIHSSKRLAYLFLVCLI